MCEVEKSEYAHVQKQLINISYIPFVPLFVTENERASSNKYVTEVVLRGKGRRERKQIPL